MRIYGAKGGGGGGHTPIEAPETGRSKQIVNIVEVLSEGEISGLADGMKSVYLNNTPIQNQDGSYNFNNVSGELNVGLQDQNVLSGYDSSQNEVSVGVEVKKSTGAIVRTVTDARITRLRFNVGVKMLYSQNDQGDTNPTSVTLRISVGDQHYDYHIHGKYSSQYLEKFEVANLPPVPFNIRVERITADSEKQRLQNGTIWTSYTEIIDTDFTYPNTAVFGVSFDSDYFNGVPTRNYLLKGIKVKVPSNYNPETRAYNGLWDGTFKIAWTDNPAWVLYDIITNKRYGLGGLIGEFGCDKWTLYDIGRYCDVLVDDGFGGKEPRFTCNAWITDIDDAYKVINNICSIFRAIPVWTGTEFSAIIDRPADPSWTYTNANVKDGKFERTYSAKKSRHNAVKVTYSDKNNGYQKAVEYVSDDESIAKNGLNLTEVTAFGCTSRGQAYRTGRWLIETEKLEKETITFTVGREGLMHLPGDIIRVNDNDYAGANVGGRVLAVNGNKITLDREITFSGNSFLTYINKSAKESTLRITAVNGTIATLASTPSDIEPYTVWALTTEQIKSGLYKAMTLTENDDGTFTVTALQHEPQKEAIVDKSAHFVPTNKTAYRAPQIQDIDTKVGYDGKLYVTADIGSGDGEVTFDVRIVKDGKLYEYRQGLTNPNLALENLPNGEYAVIIYAKNKAGQVMSEKASHFTINKPPAPTGVNVSGGLGAITIEWDWVDDATYTEIFASEDEHFANASKIAKVLSRSHVHSVGAEQIRYYWLRHVRGVNNGPFYQEQGIKGESAVDLDKKLEELNKELSKNIVDEVIDTALPARKLEMIKTVERLETPTENLGHHQIYNEEDGKLYVWDGNKYTAKVQAVDLEGQLASSQLDQTLIEQLNRADSTASSAATEASKVKNNLAQEITNRQKAIQAEATNRNNAIKAESANLTKKIQDEASARGTAISQLQNVDAQQAQQIATITAKADNALSGITAEQKARADGDKANADKVTALTARVGTAESGIATLQTSVATANRSVSELSQNLNAKIDGISVGGRNLLLKTASGSGYLRWTNKLENISSQDGKSARIEYNDPSKRNDGIYNALFNTHSIKTGQEVIVSFEYRTTSNLAYTYLIREDSRTKGNFALNQSYFESKPLSDGEWHKQIIKFKATSDIDNFRLLVGSYQPEVGTFLEVKKFKVELGNIATDWSPAPEDIESSVNAVSADLTTYKQTQASADLAQSQQITGLTTRMAGAESNITRNTTAITTLNQSTATQLNTLNSKMSSAESNIATFQSTKANKNEVASLVQSSLQAVWKADAKSAVDSLSIGARNLLIDSSYIKYYNYNPDMAVIKSASYQGRRLLRLGMLGGTGVAGIVQAQATQVSNIRQGQEYTLSLNVQGTAGIQKTGLNYVFLMRADGDNQRLATIPVIASLLNRPKITFTAEWTSERAYLLIGVNGTYENTDWLAFHSVKLEKGNVATDWTPAPEDIEGSVNAVSADLTTYKQTQANIDKAQTDQITAHTARLGSAEASLTSTSRTVATLDGKVQALHTIQAVAISGGKKAIAGISMGATGSESSVIVMADKFNVVKNAQDGNVKPMFGVVNNKVAVNGDLIADGAISARMMAANSVQAGAIQAGAIRTNHIATGEITADRLAIGLGGNLLLNPIFANVVNGVPHGWAKGAANGTVTFAVNTDKNYGLRSMGLPNENCMLIKRTDIGTTNYAELIQVVPVNRGMWYMASVYMGNHRCVKTELIIQYLDANGTAISATHKTGGNSFTGLETAERVFIKFQAPANCEKVKFYLRQTGIAGNNTNAIMFVARPMLEECTQYTTAPSAWVNSGVTSIHGGSIVANTITAKEIQAGTITAEQLASGSVTTQKIATGSINASHIISKAISADKLNVNSLSAISANLGSVTAGSIRIGSLNGSYGTLFEVNANGGFRLVARDSSGGIELSSSTRALTVWNGNTQVVKVGKL